MKKSYLQSGNAIFVLKVEQLVTKNVFATALTDYFYSKSEKFDMDLSKKKAEEILRDQLRYFGKQGEYEPGFFEGATDVADQYNDTCKRAYEYLDKKFPYLNKNWKTDENH